MLKGALPLRSVIEGNGRQLNKRKTKRDTPGLDDDILLWKTEKEVRQLESSRRRIFDHAERTENQWKTFSE